MTRPILTTNDDVATIQVDVVAARALGMTEVGIARLLLDARAAAEVLARATSKRWTVERIEPAEVTGETITDEQIWLLMETGAIPRRDWMHAVRYGNATVRARCADAYNARFGARP